MTRRTKYGRELEDCLALFTLHSYRLLGAGRFALALSPASGPHSHSIIETAALQESSAIIEREREKQCQ